jgi:propanol-preferring alcohol dehydrogenase
MATETMKAIVPALGAKLEVREVPVPEPGSGQVLVRMEASGVCTRTFTRRGATGRSSRPRRSRPRPTM